MFRELRKVVSPTAKKMMISQTGSFIMNRARDLGIVEEIEFLQNMTINPEAYLSEYLMIGDKKMEESINLEQKIKSASDKIVKLFEKIINI